MEEMGQVCVTSSVVTPRVTALARVASKKTFQHFYYDSIIYISFMSNLTKAMFAR